MGVKGLKTAALLSWKKITNKAEVKAIFHIIDLIRYSFQAIQTKTTNSIHYRSQNVLAVFLQPSLSFNDEKSKVEVLQ